MRAVRVEGEGPRVNPGGRSRTVPRTREGIGAVTSSIRMTRSVPSHSIALGPMRRPAASRDREDRPRSVMQKRRGRP